MTGGEVENRKKAAEETALPSVKHMVTVSKSGDSLRTNIQVKSVGQDCPTHMGAITSVIWSLAGEADMVRSETNLY